MPHFKMSPKCFAVATIAILCFHTDPQHSSCMWLWMGDCSFTLCLFENTPKCCTFRAVWVLHGWSGDMWKTETACSVYTIQPCTSLQCHFIQSNVHRVHVCLAVMCHLHFWQNDQALLCATSVTPGGTDTKQLRVSTESWPWRRKSSHQDSIPWPFDPKSGTPPLGYPHSPIRFQSPPFTSYTIYMPLRMSYQ